MSVYISGRTRDANYCCVLYRVTNTNSTTNDLCGAMMQRDALSVFTLLCAFYYCGYCEVSGPEEGIGVFPEDEDNGILPPEALDRIKEEESKTYHLEATRLEKEVISKGNYKTVPIARGDKLKVYYILHSVSHLSIDQVQSSMNVSGRFCMLWQDKTIYWDPAKYNGIKVVGVGRWSIWTPTMGVVNAANGANSAWDIVQDDVRIFMPPHLTNASYAISCPRFRISVGCFMDFGRFPFDKHECPFVFTDYINYGVVELKPWMTSKVTVTELKHATSRNDTKPVVSDWKLTAINSTVVYLSTGSVGVSEIKQSDYDYAVALHVVSFSRYAPQYIFTLFIPAIIIGVLNCFALLLLYASHAVILYLSSLLLLSLLLRDIVQEMPHSNSSIPTLMIFSAIQLLLAVIGLGRAFVLQNRRKPMHQKGTELTETAQNGFFKYCTFFAVFSLITGISIVALFIF